MNTERPRFSQRLFAWLPLLLLCTTVQAQDPSSPADGDASHVTREETAVQAPVDLFARDTYRIDPLICPFKGEIDYEPGQIECFLLEVPENREDPASRMIELHFVRLNSRWGTERYEAIRDEETDRHAEGLANGKRDDPVVYLTGGPGSPVTYYVNRFKDHTLLDHRDLYILEQRGIGASDNFCPWFSSRKPAAGNVATFAEYQEAAATDRRDCAINARAAGVDLTGYNTIENARDVKALRRALGFDAWNVWGISYGSILGQAYLKEDPEGIRAAAIDAIMPLDIQGSEQHWRVIHWYERDLQKLQALCQQQPACAAAYPDIPGRLREAVAGVLEQPIEVEVKDTEVFPSGKAWIFADIAALLPFTFFYEQVNYPALPGIIYAWSDALDRRDPEFFGALAGAVGGSDLFSSSEGMRMAILCNDGDIEAQANANRLDMAAYPVLGQVLGTPETVDREQALCVELGMPLRSKAEYAPTVTDIPTLIIEGDMDPITPPPNAKAILPGFRNGTYVEFAWAGHGPSRSVACAGHLLNHFYDAPNDPPRLSCAESMTEPELWAPLFVSDTLPRLAGRYFKDPKSLAVPGGWAGGSLLILVLAFLVLTVGPLVRGLNGRRLEPVRPARPLAWLTATTAVVTLGIMLAAYGVTAGLSEMILIFGLPPWARIGAWLGVVTGLLGLLTVAAAARRHRDRPIPFGSRLGFLAIGLAAIGLSSFMLAWGWSPL